MLSIIVSKRKDKRFAEVLWVVAGQFVAVLFGFVSVKLLSKLGSAEYGKFVLITTIAVLLSMIFYGPFAQGFIRFYYDYQKTGKQGLYVRYIYKNLFLITFFLLVIAVVAALILEFQKTSGVFGLSMLTSVYVLAIKVTEFVNSHLNIIRQRKLNSILQGSEKILIILLYIYIYYKDMLSLNLALFSYTFVTLCFICVKLFMINRLIKNKEEHIFAVNNKETIQMKRSLIAYMTPFLIWSVTGWLQLNGEKWIIANYLSTSDVGIYGVMGSLVGVFIIIPNNIIMDFSTPIIFERFNNFDDKEKMKEGLKYTGLIMTACFGLMVLSSVVALFIGRDLIKLISDKSYLKYSYLLPVFIFGTGLFYFGQAACMPGMALNKPQKYLMPKITAGITAMLLNIVFIKSFGLTGVSVSIVLTGALYSLYIVLINKQLLRTAGLK
ncbi:MAG: lipopolysaccharide biosynthesis protein [Ignavibacteria bacterium]